MEEKNNRAERQDDYEANIEAVLNLIAKNFPGWTAGKLRVVLMNTANEVQNRLYAYSAKASISEAVCPQEAE